MIYRKLKAFFPSKYCRLFLQAITLWWLAYPLSVFAATDDLSGIMTSVQGDFGTSSTFIKLLYLLEILAGVYAYHKTKNIAAMLGIIVVSVFLTYSLGHWVFTA